MEWSPNFSTAVLNNIMKLKAYSTIMYNVFIILTKSIYSEFYLLDSHSILCVRVTHSAPGFVAVSIYSGKNFGQRSFRDEAKKLKGVKVCGKSLR